MQLHGLGIGDGGFLHVGKKQSVCYHKHINEKHCTLPIMVLTNSLYISFWSQSSGAEPNLSWVFCGEIIIIKNDKGAWYTMISVWLKLYQTSLPEWSAHPSVWPLSGTWALPGRYLFSTLSCLVCRMCRYSEWTSQGTELKPGEKNKTIH